LLFGRVYIGEFNLPPGKHDVAIEFLSADGSVLEDKQLIDYEIGRKNLELIQAFSLK